MKRSAGILLPVSALPSPHGVGTLGKAAYDFVDFLVKAGQSYWQMLPLGPTGFGDSPYQCVSSSAGNPYYIDLDLLVEQELLTSAEVRAASSVMDQKNVNYQMLYAKREELLRSAFLRVGSGSLESDVAHFRQENADWVEEYAFYRALKSHFGMKSWAEWEDEGIRRRIPGAKEHYWELLREDISYHVFVQFEFFKQWDSLKSYAAKKKIRIIGDLPIYVPLDSVETWLEPCLFQLDEKALPISVAGVPPDAFSKEGQLWGSPLYNWKAMKADDYSWWLRRIAATKRLFDVIRIDHFRGFESYWEIPYGEKTAINGKWTKGPGMDLIGRIKRQFPELEFIAEDLGFLTKEVRQLVLDSGFPGMKVMQFAFESGGNVEYLPHSYERNCVVYTGTHDNTTLWGWLLEAGEEELKLAKEYLSLSRKEGWDKGLLRGGLSSVANLFIAQMQDYLGLSGWARMNRPGTIGANWRWRMETGQMTEVLAENIKKMTQRYGR
ncbi:MAG: 4-alpha-glucanotransferase [Eubacteriales bacterium]|nr:4-alpha-glucanotransferase [Eubacteriales bacterium]